MHSQSNIEEGTAMAISPTCLPENGFVVVAKRECPTCRLVESVLGELGSEGESVIVYVQDDANYANGLADVRYDQTLERSYRLNVEIVPTLIRFSQGHEIDRCYGWHQDDWRRVSGQAMLGEGLPFMRPGCGSKTLDPGTAEALAIRHGGVTFHSRLVEPGDEEDLAEACMDRGWSDGLPVIPPTQDRVLRMLAGTTRSASEVLGQVPPDLATCTVEKVAANAVMAGCKPEYLPVVIAAVEAIFEEPFAMHGLLCTTHFAAPMVIVNGPIGRAIGMNSGINALGQGNRANASIGRALQLVVRNVGGGRPGEIDRSTIGFPGKYTFCFAEAEIDGWEPLSQQHGAPPGSSAVTVYAGGGLLGIMDQKSRTPESLARGFAQSMRVVDHAKSVSKADVLLVVSPEHARVFVEAGWSKARLIETLHEMLYMDGGQLAPGSDGMEEGMPNLAGKSVAKFRPGGILIVRAGGGAGMFSAIVPSWAAAGERGSVPITKEIKS